MKNKVARWMAVAALVAGPGAAWAIPVEWTVGPSTLQDGSTLSGSFIYDADTDTYSNVNVARSVAGNIVTTFTARQQTGGWQHIMFFPAPVTGSFNQQTSMLISANFPGWSQLTNSGGSSQHWVDIGVCTNATCSSLRWGGPRGPGIAFVGRVLADPGATAASIPTLSEWGLIGLSSLIGLAAVVHTRRHRSLSRLPSRRV
ncbi:MAG: IPTL-CTERM sorting domain-containing protein [Comamonadaceae bacterium]|nr:MAG: IPTL-CTERM sorting domain-containing protein [Comamonadaceae bacterium]